MIGIIIAGISAIAGFMGSTGAAIASIGPSIVAAIGQVSTALAEIATPLINALKMYGPIIEKVLDLIHAIAGELKIGIPEIDQGELGARALEHPEISLGDYNTYEEYIVALENAEFDRERYNKAGDGEKAVYKAMGAALEAKAIEEKLMMNIPVMTFVDIVRSGMSAKNVIDIFNEMKNNGMDDTTLLVSCLDRNLGNVGNSKLEQIIQSHSGKELNFLKEEYQKNAMIEELAKK